MSKLNVRNVTVEYTMKRKQQRILAVQGVSFSAQSGQFVTLVGPSGCGKTTLLNVICGSLSASSGDVWINGDVVKAPGRNRSMVFQSPSLLPWRTVLHNITYGLELQGANKKYARSKAQNLVTLVGLENFKESYPHELSGGMQQRVNLARALATDPELLLLDEPLAALDPLTREFMQFELQRIWLETRKTALLVTHQISEAIFLGDQVIVLSARPGHVIEIIPVDLPRPRPLNIKVSPRFLELEEHIWNLVQIEFAKTSSAQPLVQ